MGIGLDGYPIQPIVFHQFWIGFGYDLKNCFGYGLDLDMEIIALPNTRKIVYTVATCSLHNTKYLVSLHWQENTILSNLDEVNRYAKKNYVKKTFFKHLLRPKMDLTR